MTDAEALAQMQCLAEETGGTFLTASNADELTAALNTVATETAPVPVPAILRAVEGDENAPLLDDPVMWTVTGPDGTVLTTDEQTNPLVLDVLPGAYEITAYRAQVETALDAQLQVIVGNDNTLTVVFEKPAVKATLEAAESAPMGSDTQVSWQGPAGKDDYIAVVDPLDDSGRVINYTYVRDGNPVSVTMPPREGDFELRYYQKDRTVIGTRPITVTPVTALIEAAETAPAGSELAVTWQGPDYKRDFIAVGEQGKPYINYAYTKDGSPASVTMPTKAGRYELRYVMDQDRTQIATRVIDVVDVTASVTPPAQATAGATVAVPWEGPDYTRDFIAVGKPGAPYINYVYTKNGTPAQLLMPIEPGDYEVRYVLDQDREIIATATITIAAAEASVTPPAQAVAGAMVAVPWQGPDYTRDFIAVGKPGEPYVNYAYTKNGTPAQLLMPTEPGDYEIRYVLDQDREIIATAMITVGAVTAGITPPQDAPVGATVAVRWEGPDYKRDFIAVAKPDEPYINYVYTKDGNPARVEMPATPGDYELRYVLDQDNLVIATVPLTVTDVTVTLNAPASGAAGTTIAIPFEGPGYARDYIGIGAPGSVSYETYVYARKGEIAKLKLPETPGDYELFYMMDEGNRVMARQPFTVTP